MQKDDIVGILKPTGFIVGFCILLIIILGLYKLVNKNSTFIAHYANQSKSKIKTQKSPTLPSAMVEYIKNIASPYVSYGEAINITKECLKYPNGMLLLSLAISETNLNPKAVNLQNAKKILWLMVHGKPIPRQLIPIVKKLAIGLMQIKPWYWCKHQKKTENGNIIFDADCVRQLFDYKHNIRLANKILLEYIKQTGSIPKALKKYQGMDPDKILKTYGMLCLLNNGGKGHEK